MDINDIQTTYENLVIELKQALSTMERSDRAIKIRNAIKDLQLVCPHNNGNFDFTTTTECPYCGKKFKG